MLSPLLHLEKMSTMEAAEKDENWRNLKENTCIIENKRYCPTCLVLIAKRRKPLLCNNFIKQFKTKTKWPKLLHIIWTTEDRTQSWQITLTWLCSGDTYHCSSLKIDTVISNEIKKLNVIYTDNIAHFLIGLLQQLRSIMIVGIVSIISTF